jgi:hypothetical protein
MNLADFLLDLSRSWRPICDSTSSDGVIVPKLDNGLRDRANRVGGVRKVDSVPFQTDTIERGSVMGRR